jgi:hypothetical protein
MDKLTEEQKRIKLAEFEGWKAPLKDEDGIEDLVGYSGPIKMSRWGIAAVPPDYFHCLNAVAKLEEKLQDKCKYWPDYIDELSKMFRVGFPNKDATNWSQMCHASATQRSEAIGITLGLWKEGQ